MYDKVANYRIIAETYSKCHNQLIGYIQLRIADADDIQDVAQNAFMRLLEYKEAIDPRNVRNLLYKISSNLINDYYRHFYTKSEVHAQLAGSAESEIEDTENTVLFRDLLRLEQKCVENMPAQRRRVYLKRIHQGKNSKEVSDELSISKRTAENHFYRGINQMRDYLRMCI